MLKNDIISTCMALVVEDCFVASVSNLLLSIYKTTKPGKVILSGLLLLIKTLCYKTCSAGVYSIPKQSL